MKAISLWEPWATAMALGSKENETRSWPTNHRGDLAICSAKRPIDEFSWKLVELLMVPIATWKPPYGCVLCVVNLRNCIKTDLLETDKLSEVEKLFGNYLQGRYAWVTDNLRILKNPIPVRGHQGLFDLPEGIERKVMEQISL